MRDDPRLLNHPALGAWCVLWSAFLFQYYAGNCSGWVPKQRPFAGQTSGPGCMPRTSCRRDLGARSDFCSMSTARLGFPANIIKWLSGYLAQTTADLSQATGRRAGTPLGCASTNTTTQSPGLAGLTPAAQAHGIIQASGQAAGCTEQISQHIPQEEERRRRAEMVGSQPGSWQNMGRLAFTHWIKLARHQRCSSRRLWRSPIWDAAPAGDSAH